MDKLKSFFPMLNDVVPKIPSVEMKHALRAHLAALAPLQEPTQKAHKLLGIKQALQSVRDSTSPEEAAAWANLKHALQNGKSLRFAQGSDQCEAAVSSMKRIHEGRD